MAKMLGSVDLLGLNNFGNPVGLSPIWGAAIGGTVAGGTAILLRHTATAGAKHPEAYGLLAGLAASGAMYAMKSTRHAAIGSALGAFLASGLALLERTLFATATVSAQNPAAASQTVAGMGIPMINPLNGLGIPQARALNGLGLPMISPTPHAQGTIPGVAGNQLAGAGSSMPPVSLMGPMSPQAAHLRGVGGPAVHGLSAAYGATLMGGGR
jgi:hypothetical protein